MLVKTSIGGGTSFRQSFENSSEARANQSQPIASRQINWLTECISICALSARIEPIFVARAHRQRFDHRAPLRCGAASWAASVQAADENVAEAADREKQRERQTHAIKNGDFGRQIARAAGDANRRRSIDRRQRRCGRRRRCGVLWRSPTVAADDNVHSQRSLRRGRRSSFLSIATAAVAVELVVGMRVGVRAQKTRNGRLFIVAQRCSVLAARLAIVAAAARTQRANKSNSRRVGKSKHRCDFCARLRRLLVDVQRRVKRRKQLPIKRAAARRKQLKSSPALRKSFV